MCSLSEGKQHRPVHHGTNQPLTYAYNKQFSIVSPTTNCCTPLPRPFSPPRQARITHPCKGLRTRYSTPRHQFKNRSDLAPHIIAMHIRPPAPNCPRCEQSTTLSPIPFRCCTTKNTPHAYITCHEHKNTTKQHMLLIPGLSR